MEEGNNMHLRTLTDKEIIRAVLNGQPTEMEKELATRLAYANEVIDRLENEKDNGEYS
jgi:hypothetical protein